MADTEQIRQQVQSPAPFSTWLGVVLLMVLFGALAVAIIGPAPRGDTYEQQRAQNREKKLKDLRDEDAKALTAYAWIDKNKGSVRIPIERAMQVTVAELANKKPTTAGPIATPAPEASAAASAAPAASPAQSASSHATGTPKPTSVAGPGSEAHGQPAAAVNPPPVQPGTQPGANASPGASPKSPTAAPAVSP
ncbi:MAG TPA: hypothetical protein VNX27_04190 [Chthoniobacterales bacterium]|jgi:hypothetical protein|nr:hypothetical protein [Chthoniobacterales bacterium]